MLGKMPPGPLLEFDYGRVARVVKNDGHADVLAVESILIGKGANVLGGRKPLNDSVDVRRVYFHAALIDFLAYASAQIEPSALCP